MKLLTLVIVEGLYNNFKERSFGQRELRDYLTKVKRIPRDYVSKVMESLEAEGFLITEESENPRYMINRIKVEELKE